MVRDAKAEIEAKRQRIQALGQEVLLGRGKIGKIDVDFEGEDGSVYTGEIQFHKPDARDLMKMAGLKSAFIQRQFLDDDGNIIPVDPALIDSMLYSMSEIVSTLQVVVDACPQWFADIEAVDDVSLLFHVFGRYQEWRNSFRKGSPTESGGLDQGADAGDASVGS